MDDFRKQLDALMGSNRNGDRPSSKAGDFTEPNICKYFLCGLCPYELFMNTKMDLGICDQVHSSPLRQEYEECRKRKDYGYERLLEKTLEQYIFDCDRKIEKARRRLENQETDQIGDTAASQITELLTKAETLGEEGRVDEAKELLNKVEQLKQQKPPEQIVIPIIGDITTTQQQKLRVCDICGAYLSVYDSDRRLADHFGGKLHIGYLAVREKLKELKTQNKSYDNKEKERTKEREREDRNYRNKDNNSRNRERGRDSERETKRQRSHSHEKNNSKSVSIRKY